MVKYNFLFVLLVALAACNDNTSGNEKARNDSLINNAASQPAWALLPFVKVDSANPVLKPGGDVTFICPIWKKPVAWMTKDVFNPAVVVSDNSVILLFRAQDSIGRPAGTSRIGLAASKDGLHFTILSSPVLYPDNDGYKKYEWEGGCEDPRVVQDSAGTYYMTYTAFDGKQARLFIATSTDLYHWQKHGCVFAKAYKGRYMNVWSKSGSIVSTYSSDGKITAAKINGKYWMYWGDKYIWTATSDDLINWAPVERQPGDTTKDDITNYGVDVTRLKPVIKPRTGMFDNDLAESGPPAMLTDKGIVLLYNGRNMPPNGDKSLVEGTYTSCQVLLDKADPTHVADRMNSYFMKPEKPYELTGQVNQVCFIEGLALFNNKWWLYYGTADSKIAVAVKDNK